MPLPLPNLDDRRWADLVDEGRALVPRYARQWTDHNISDPGVTLIELFAWMTESSVYSLNAITARHRRKFLALIGFPPRPPAPGRAMLRLSPAAGTTPFLLSARLEFDAAMPAGGEVPLRTLRAVTVCDVRLDAVQVQANATAAIKDRTVEWINGLPIAVFGTRADSGAAVYFGFKAIPVKEPVTLAMRWERPGKTATERAAQSADERARLIAEAVARARACRHPLPDITCAGVAPAPEPPHITPRHHSARVAWEVFTGTWTPLAPIASPSVPAEGEVADDTRSLTLDGIVELNLPSGTSVTALGTVPGSLIYIRCRLESGPFDAPPVLLDIVPNAVPAEQSVPLATRFAIPPAVVPAGVSGTVPKPGESTRFEFALDATGAIEALTFTPAAAGHPDFAVLGYEKVAGTEGHVTLAFAIAGRGSGLPNQDMLLPSHQIASDGLLAVHSHDGSSWQPWTIRESFDASQRTDWHCTIDHASGVLYFGDGERGRVVPANHLVVVTAHATAGAAGAVASGARLRMRASAVNELLLKGFAVPANVLAGMTTTAWPVSGASDRETLESSWGRAAETLHAHERILDLARQTRVTSLDDIAGDRVRALPAPSKAVSVLDLERLALDVPGTRVARAHATAGMHARFPCLSAPGWVSLVIVPAMPVPQPQPSRGLLQAVKRYLDRRRIVTTLLHIVGPTYVSVSVTARVRVRRGNAPPNVQAAVAHALTRFLDPLRGGPDGLGWPFGRDVFRAEIMQLIDGVAGVDHVLDLSLSGNGGTPQCGNLTVCPTALAAPGTFSIAVE